MLGTTILGSWNSHWKYDSPADGIFGYYRFWDKPVPSVQSPRLMCRNPTRIVKENTSKYYSNPEPPENITSCLSTEPINSPLCMIPPPKPETWFSCNTYRFDQETQNNSRPVSPHSLESRIHPPQKPGASRSFAGFPMDITLNIIIKNRHGNKYMKNHPEWYPGKSIKQKENANLRSDKCVFSIHIENLVRT